MIHTFELSKEISLETFEIIVSRKELGLRWDKSKSTFNTTRFSDNGIPMIYLRKEADKSNPKFKHCMIYLSINSGKMFHGDPHYGNNTNTFTPSFMDAIMQNIFEVLPWLEKIPQARTAISFDMLKEDISLYEKWKALHKAWMEENAFTLNRLDYCMDIYFNVKEYESLLKRGYPIKSRQYIRINIYNKAKEISDRGIETRHDSDYEFLRLEVQANKGYLEYLLKKLKNESISGYSDSQARQLEFLASPEIEEEVLTHYIGEITGTGLYVSKETAKKIIDNSNSFSFEAKQKMYLIIEEITKRHGISKLLQLVDSGKVTQYGKRRTVEQYLRNIHSLGINPVTLSSRMTGEMMTLNYGGNIVKVLLNLVDIIKFLENTVKEERMNGPTVTEDDLRETDKIGMNSN